MTLAILMGVYHEEGTIGTCLRRHQKHADVVYVTHDGPCSDATMDIAGRMGAVCHETKVRQGWGDPNYDLSRIAALKDGYKWGMILSPDEKWSTVLLEHMQFIITEADKLGCTGIQVRLRTQYLPQTPGFPSREDAVTRLIRLDKSHWRGIIHAGIVLDPPGIFDKLHTDYCIEHWPLAADNTDKKKRYLEVARRQLAEAKSDRVRNHLEVAIKGMESAPD